MNPALWISKTGLDAQQTDISVISNNLANASTVGYKKSRAIGRWWWRPSAWPRRLPPSLEEIQRKSRVREWTPQNAPRIRTGVTKKDQKAELKKNQTRRCYAKKTSIFSQTTGRHPPGARRETTEVKTRKC